MASSVWKGMITFGLVSVPIRLYVAARSKRIYLHQLHKDCHSRLKQPLFCPTCDRTVDRSEVIKGYEYETGQYVLIDGDEIKQIMPASSRTMEILAFVDADKVDPIYFDASYLATPDADAAKPYALLVRALKDTNKMAVAKLTMHQREYTVFVRHRENGLTLHTTYYANEINSVQDYGTDNAQLKPQEIKLAEELVNSLSAPFKPQDYRDEFQERLRELVEAKTHGKTVTTAQSSKRAPVIDIMQALKQSLAANGDKKQQRPKQLMKATEPRKPARKAG
jgi:DNA end-binding protein Ku